MTEPPKNGLGHTMTHKQRCKHGCRDAQGVYVGTPLHAPGKCEHKESDQLGPICLWCWRVKWPRAESVVIIGAVLYFGIQMIRWSIGGFEVIR